MPAVCGGAGFERCRLEKIFFHEWPDETRRHEESHPSSQGRHVEELVHRSTRLIREGKELLGEARNHVERRLERHTQGEGQQQQPGIRASKTEDMRKRSLLVVDEHEEEQRAHETKRLAEHAAHRIEGCLRPRRDEHQRHQIEGEKRRNRPQGRNEEGHGRKRS